MARRPATRRPTDAEIAAAIKTAQVKAVAWGVPMSILAAAVFALACTPVAHAIAGKKTDLVVSITFSLSIVFSITTAIGAGAAVIYRRANRRLKTRNGELERKVKEAKDENARLEHEVSSTHGRIQDLEDAAGS